MFVSVAAHLQDSEAANSIKKGNKLFIEGHGLSMIMAYDTRV